MPQQQRRLRHAAPMGKGGNEGGWLKRKAINAWQHRPRSSVEAYEMLRDYVILTPRFQYVWWVSLVFVIIFEVAYDMSMEFFLMTVIYW